MNHDRLWAIAAAVLLTAVSFWWFPGHTILQSDTQVYIPILQHLENPAVLAQDEMAVRPHVGFTIYDEIALGLRRLTGLSFEHLLAAQQVLFRALGILGVFLFARAAGLSPAMSFVAAALLALGATVNGPQVLTVEYEPVPRGFAFGLLMLSLGLLAGEAWMAAAVACSAAFAYHPPTALVIWTMLAGFCVRERRWRELGVLGVGPLLVVFSVLRQPGAGGALGLLATIDPALEAILRMRASYGWVDTWVGRYWLHYAVLLAAGLAGAWRLRLAVGSPARVFLWALPLAGAVSVGVSWVVLEQMKWAVGPQFQPARYLMYVSFFAALNCAIAGLRAASLGRVGEASAFLLVPFLIPLSPDLFSVSWSAAALAAVLALATAFARRVPVFVAPALLAFALYPTAGGVVNYPIVHSAELQELVEWARHSTPSDAVFQFADVRRGLEPGIFRVRAERAIFADWKAGGQVNFLPEFAKMWADRWNIAERPKPLSVYRELDVDYVVFTVDKAPKGADPVWSNRKWAVFRVRA